MNGRELARSLQVLLPFSPFLQETRCSVQRLWYRWRGRPIDSDLLGVRQLGLQPGDTLLDVGANRGFVLDALLWLTEGTRIVAFEPNPRLAGALARRYRNQPRVDCRAVGLGARPGRFTLWVPFYRDWPFDGLASIEPANAASWLNPERLYGFKPERLRLEPVACDIVRLDDLDLAPSFIKLDVQGYELSVLEGGESTLQRFRPILLVEESDDDEVWRFLVRLDYVVAAFERGRFTIGRRGRRNSFFLPRERAARLDGLASCRPGQG